MSRLITEPNSCIRTVIAPRDAPAQKSLKKRGGGEEGEGEGREWMSFFSPPLLFQENSLVSAPLIS